MKNRYGGPLRHKVAERFHLKFYIDMVDTPAFHRDVIAYPAITVITNKEPASTRVAHQPNIEPTTLSKLAAELLCATTTQENGVVHEAPGGILNAEPWVFESFDRLEVARRLERDFPTIEEAGCKVGIGVATGADKAFIGPFDELDVESDRKLPLAMTRDIQTGEVACRGLGVINPFADDGRLVNLGRYPKLAGYLSARKEVLCKRHVAKKNPKRWYRTIDRIDPELAGKPKLLIPDIKGEAHMVYEDGRLYPHHNLYYITSASWDLQALQAVLRSGIAHLFVSIYSTKMRGGYLRFQAQYLRRIRLPHWVSIPDAVKAVLIEAAASHDRQRCYHAYELSDREKAVLSSCFD